MKLAPKLPDELKAKVREQTHKAACFDDLLAALEDVLHAYNPGWAGENYSDIGGATSRARAAIAKAKG